MVKGGFLEFDPPPPNQPPLTSPPIPTLAHGSRRKGPVQPKSDLPPLPTPPPLPRTVAPPPHTRTHTHTSIMVKPSLRGL